MRKLKLELEALTVESFAVNASADAGRGTVRGAAGQFFTVPVDPSDTENIGCISLPPCVPSNEATCGAMTCADTCWPTCHC